MSNYIYDQTTGIVIPNTQDIKNEVTEEFKAALNKPDLDTSESTPQGRLIETETIARKRTIENMAMLVNMFNPQQSYGMFLDSLAALFGIEREGATRTRVTCTLTGTVNTIIPQGVQAKDTAGNTYYLENSVTIIGNSVSADFLCTEKGAIQCEAGTLTQIVTAISGWQQITNPSAGQTGLAGESDNELRQSLASKQYQGTALLNSIRSAILEVADVKSCYVIDNPSSTTKIIENARDSSKNILMPAHSLYVCVDGGDEQAIAQAIFDTKSCGCAYASNHNETVIRDYGQDYNIYFDNFSADGGAETIAIYVEVYIKTGSSNDLTEAVKNAIKAYANNEIPSVDGLKLGVNVNAFEIACAINDQIPEVFVQSVKIGLSSATINQDNILIGVNEKAVIEADNIVVNQITR